MSAPGGGAWPGTPQAELPQPRVQRLTVLWLGISQLVCWGISYYLVGALGELMVADLGWSRSLVYGGFSASLVVMGVCSPWVGQAIDRFGGRPVMAWGSLGLALGCAALARAHTVATYYAAWVVLGVAMRMTLYDAAFATLARLAGASARRPISQITLLGGLASTTFWPIGFFLAERLGWRGAVLVYAGIAVLTVPLHLALPRTPPRRAEPPGESPGREETAPAARAAAPEPWVDEALYAIIVTLATFLNSGMSAHMIDLLTSLGMGAALAVWISTLRGIGQSSARLAEVAFGARLHPLALAVLATAIVPVGFAAGLLAGRLVWAGVAFTFLYGAGNGLVTIVRGTLPLVLFDPGVYGRLVGRLLVPSFLFSAVAPLAYALVIQNWGDAAAFYGSIAVAGIVLAAAVALRLRHSARGVAAGG